MTATTEETTVHPGALDRMRARAVSDYLAVSRNANLYSSTDDYLAAENKAWERLRSSVDRARRVAESELT